MRLCPGTPAVWRRCRSASDCPNVKYVRDGSVVEVEIEKGMKDGQTLVFFGEGEPIMDGDPGDLKVGCQV